MLRRRLTITGRVQNVFYRDWFVGEMRTLGIRGWVRNRADGTVEAVIEGPGEMIDAAIARARQGSPAARVVDVTVAEEPGHEVLAGFVKRATA